MALGPLAHVDPWQDRVVEEGRNRYYGEYLGIVKDRNDPTKTGRVRVHVPAITSEEDVEEHWLDWCLPKSAGLNIPPIGATVIVTFEQGYVTHGMYTHGWLTGSDAASSSAPVAGKGELDETWLDKLEVKNAGVGQSIPVTLPADTARDNRFKKPEYGYNKAYKSESGHVLELDDTPGFPRARYYHPAGTTILVDADGSLQIRSAGAQYFRPGGDFVVALGEGATFKVLYPEGTGFSCGADGFHVGGHAASLLGRTVVRREKEIQ